MTPDGPGEYFQKGDASGMHLNRVTFHGPNQSVEVPE